MNNKSELVAQVASRLDISGRKAAQAVDCVLDTITDLAFNDGPVTLRGFGRFEVRNRAPRVVRSGVTGAHREFSVPARSSLAFKASVSLRR